MPRLEAQDLTRIREIQTELRTLVDGAPPALDAFVPALRGLLGVDRVLGYVLAPRGEGLRVEHGVAEGLPPDTMSTFDEWLRDKTVGWGGFNPIRPEPDQRNAVVTTEQLRKLHNGSSSLIMRELHPRFGLTGFDRLRVVLCDGASMLAWVGAFQAAPFDKRQVAIVEELVPAIQRRLKIERLLEKADATESMTAAAFDAIPAAAFVLGEGGEVHYANAAGELMLDRDASLRGTLRGALRGEAPGFDSTKVTTSGAPTRFLVTHRASADAQADGRAAAAAARWGLTRRQHEVLGLLVRGQSNRTIAAALGMAEKTVEVHLTAMFEKTQVASRAALVAKVWSS